MRRIDLRAPWRWYGAGPLHLLVLVASFALAGYAAIRFVPANPVGVAAWFVGAVVCHDLVLLPLYSLLDLGAAAVLRRRPAALPSRSSVNYLRVPAVLSGLLFLVFAPLILRLPPGFEYITGRPVTPYLSHWLLVTAALFAGSAVLLAWRARPRSRRDRGLTNSSAPDAEPPAP
ncbi:hypothetical protein SAMN05421678_13032 [Actinopolymorpha cephalotaxi]|uniref:Uncharacterized protein n=1 Tax=Actinopolymorpha cephalotaxi TaxID=504797 RepID=A0A1I3C996_9ACTN|nr:hypothetical protein [Actinopolymorpha cephalotaxi]NYH86853.1 hypothetical protein [Actinopolymorpha cephalotaxi]SFH70749.1 hypothetical protein SAMN05421678_13032 [Actinopolymorpha cephalotaxi]